MITEDYCSYEVAKLLKEKGFDERCPRYYGEYKSLIWGSIYGQPYNTRLSKGNISAPTHQMAMKWLRGKGIYIVINPGFKEPMDYWYSITTKKDYTEKNLFPTYEQAVEAALKYALENLI